MPENPTVNKLLTYWAYDLLGAEEKHYHVPWGSFTCHTAKAHESFSYNTDRVFTSDIPTALILLRSLMFRLSALHLADETKWR